MTRAERLSEGYYELRKQSPALRRLAGPYEGRPWLIVGKTLRRDGNDGSKLLVYEIEACIEACIVMPDGESRTFA